MHKEQENQIAISRKSMISKSKNLQKLLISITIGRTPCMALWRFTQVPTTPKQFQNTWGRPPPRIIASILEKLNFFGLLFHQQLLFPNIDRMTCSEKVGALHEWTSGVL